MEERLENYLSIVLCGEAGQDKIDILIPFSRDAIFHVENRISPKTLILAERKNIEDEYRTKYKIWEVPFSQIATEVGSKLYTNTVAVGTIAGLFQVEPALIEGYLNQLFVAKGKEIIQKNIEAAKKGYTIGEALLREEGIEFNIQPNPETKEEILLNGTEAVALGTIVGGCFPCQICARV
ncbi:MAG: 2-oxoacid:acceptor oxidoreductase family protein [Candidatus Desulfofervidaceae bacterium]|nr:2-oxoacid:acceptor oxidoreductase family protein [Candidatus Desulfofervidaceae bacterium]